MEKTTIQVNGITLERLKSMKRHSRESYDETLNYLLDEAESDELTSEEIEDIKEALEEVKRGETIPFEKVLEERGIKL
jgi:macrodomain Ter protein organizer (MatP/YcbG family)